MFILHNSHCNDKAVKISWFYRNTNVQRNLVYATRLNCQIHITFQPDGVNLWYFKQKLPVKLYSLPVIHICLLPVTLCLLPVKQYSLPITLCLLPLSYLCLTFVFTKLMSYRIRYVDFWNKLTFRIGKKLGHKSYYWRIPV